MTETSTTTIDRPRRYIIVRAGSGRIVATCGGTHRTMERICQRLDREYHGTHVYDNVSQSRQYLPQIGPNLPLRRTAVSA